MDPCSQIEKAKSVKKVTILNQEISEDLLKKMNFAETKKFCLHIESELRKFLAMESAYFKLLNLAKHTKLRHLMVKNGFFFTTFLVSSTFIIKYMSL